MPLKIVSQEAPMPVETLTMVIYGQPGIGKTSTGFTASRPLCLDFDGGAHRSAFRKDTVPVKTWEEVAEITREDVAGYDTLLVDTGGRALDCITEFIGREQPKLTQRSGALTLQGYGELKAIFLNWLKRVRLMGLDVVILAHDAEDKQGDDIVVRPDIQGGSKGELVKAADVIGYMYRYSADKTVVNWNPTDRSIGKNPAQLDPMVVPDFSTNPEWLTAVIGGIKTTLNEQTEEQRKFVEAMQAFKAHVQAQTTPDQVNELVTEARDMSGAMRDQAKRVVMDHAKALGFEWDRENGGFIDPNAEATENASEGDQAEQGETSSQEQESTDTEAQAGNQGTKRKSPAKKSTSSKTGAKSKTTARTAKREDEVAGQSEGPAEEV